MDHFCYLYFLFVTLSCLFNAALWSPAGKGLTPWLSCAWCFVVFCHFPVWCPGSGEVLLIFDSLLTLLYKQNFREKQKHCNTRNKQKNILSCGHL